MKKLFFMLALVAMSVLAMGQDNQLVWANGRLLYGTPIESIDSLTYDEMEDVDTLHLLLPRTLIKVVHDTVVKTEVVHDTLIQTQVVHDTIIEIQTQIVHDTVYIEMDCGDNDTPSSGIGVFSVGERKTVTFSKGNLQYHPANDEWRFAENQTDYIGYANASISSTYNGWLDLFGWSTSANNFGVSTSTDYYAYLGSFVDWGTNQIGGDAPNTWRTLTYYEWHNVVFYRPIASSLCGVAQVNGVNGLILLPDNWVCPEGVTFKSGFHSEWGVDYYATYQTFTAAEWSKLESAGAVFLPAAGSRLDSRVGNMQYNGFYWSATENGSGCAYDFGFCSDVADMNGGSGRNNGFSVRLVKDL